MADVNTRAPLPRNVKILAAVSFLTDVASEMVYPLMPLFLTTVIGANATAIGTIEGLAESLSSLLRIPAGWWSDRTKRRKPLVVIGYTISSLVRPLIGLAQSASQVLLIRLSDRFGKGLRTAPRDALIADSVDSSRRGYAFGVHRGADNLGAVCGPLIAWVALTYGLADLRTLFAWTAVPGVLSVVLVVWLLRDTPQPAKEPARDTLVPETSNAPLGGAFWRLIGVVFVFTLSLSTDAFLLLRASQLGVSASLIPILWAALHVVKVASGVYGGALSDRVGRRPLILGGWVVYAAVYVGFAYASTAWHIWALFVVYGVFFGMTEGAERAMVADLAPAARRGAAYGWFNAAVGLGALPASILFGLVWDTYGASTAFLAGASIATLATVLFALLVPLAARPPRGASFTP